MNEQIKHNFMKKYNLFLLFVCLKKKLYFVSSHFIHSFEYINMTQKKKGKDNGKFHGLSPFNEIIL